MIKNSAALFKQVRSMKRNQTMLSYSTAKDIITSAKDLKKVRSTKQIDINTFMQNKNEKIKNIDEKLQVHQSQINRNNQIIQQLNSNFLNLKVHLDKEKENTQNQERKNKLLRQQIQRTNKILRTKNSKIEQLTKKINDFEKENQILKISAAKNQQYTKTITNLRNKITGNQQNIQDLKGIIAQRDRQILKSKDKIFTLENSKIKQDDLNNQLINKDILIGTLKQNINQLQIQKSKFGTQKSIIESKVEKLTLELQKMKQINIQLKQKYETREKKFVQLKSKLQNIQSQNKQSLLKMKNRDKQQFCLKNQITKLQLKITDLSNEADQKNKLINQKDIKIQKFSQKIKQLQNNLGQNYKEKEKLKAFQQKIQILKKRLQNLQQLYYSVIPQIQCPFGHELNNPVTIIPCGHNYCLGCKKGYNKQCMQCSGKLKIQAVYRNQLMDDIIGMVSGIKQVIQILK